MATNGAFTHPQVQFTPVGAGLRTPLATLVQPGGEVVAYVRSGGPVDGDHPDIRKRMVTTLNAALAYCRSGYGDTVVVMPGHAENISSADQMSNLVAGTRIIGMGHGTMRPTFTWTAASATFLFDVANVQLENCILNMDPGTGTTTVAAPITVSAAGCAIRGCMIRCGTDANSKVSIGLTTTAAGDDFIFDGNFMYGATAAATTTMIQFVGADRLQFTNNVVIGATSGVAVGVVRFLTTASTNIYMVNNTLINTLASSTDALTGMAGLTGFIDHLRMGVQTGVSGFVTVGSTWVGRQVYVSDGGGTRAALFGTEAT